ncbi:unnamed protein product [Mytilus edulis]|uniref:Uncharacterized protein n=1 Tax=Mytilus edulis TaxID=6550 RepID=A0A8S3RSM6_MYTED|nr:unnamed protein product [Mytilus edulis]
MILARRTPYYEHWNCSMCKGKTKYLYRHLQKIQGLDKVKSIRMAIGSTREELDFSYTSQTCDVDKIIPDEHNNELQDDNMGQQLEVSDSQSPNEEQQAEHMETDFNWQENNIEAVSVMTVSDDELSEDTNIGRSETYVQKIITSMRKRTHYVIGERTGSTFDVLCTFLKSEDTEKVDSKIDQNIILKSVDTELGEFVQPESNMDKNFETNKTDEQEEQKTSEAIGGARPRKYTDKGKEFSEEQITKSYDGLKRLSEKIIRLIKTVLQGVAEEIPLADASSTIQENIRLTNLSK